MELSDSSDESLQRKNGVATRYVYSESESPSEGVVTAVAAAADRPLAPPENRGGPDLLPPLYEAIDPDALDDLFDADAGRPTDRTVRFRYCGYSVAVDGEAVLVEPTA